MQKFEWLFLLNLSPVFLFKVRRARAIKYKPQGIYGPPAEKGSVSRALADVFEKNEKKNKTTSVYRLLVSYLSPLVSNFKGRVKFKTQHSLNSYVRCVLSKTRVDLFS